MPNWPCICAMGSDAILTARVMTCCKSAEKALLPVKVVGVLLVVPIRIHQKKKRPDFPYQRKPGRGFTKRLSLQEFQHGLRFRVCLRERSDGGLREHLRLSQVSSRSGHIGIANLALGGREARNLRLRQADGVLQFVFAGANFTLHKTEGLDRSVDGVDRVRGIRSG